MSVDALSCLINKTFKQLGLYKYCNFFHLCRKNINNYKVFAIKIYDVFAKANTQSSGSVLFDPLLHTSETSVCTQCPKAKDYTCLGLR